MKFLITIQVEFDLLGIYFFDPHELHLHITLRWGENKIIKKHLNESFNKTNRKLL